MGRRTEKCSLRFLLRRAPLALQFFDVFEDPQKTSRRWLIYAIALILFLLAMFSKTVACALPPTILLMIWYRRGKIRVPEILVTLPFFIIGGGLAYITTISEHGKAGTRGPDWMFSSLARSLYQHPETATTALKLQALFQEFIARTFIAGQDLWFYIAKIFIPFPVMQIYPRFSYDLSNPTLYIAPIAFLILIIVLFLARKKIGRGPIVALLFFFGSLLPALGYINFYTMIYTFAADHYQYLSCIALIVLAVETVLWLLRLASLRAEGAKRFYTLTTSLFAGGVLLCLSLLSFFVANLYTSAQALWQWNTDMNPKAFAAWNNLAEAFQTHKPISQQDASDAQKLALDAYRHSIEAEPRDWRAYENIGVMYLNAGMLEPALRFLNEGEERMPVSNQEQRAEFFTHLARTTQRVQDTNRQTGMAYSVFGPEFHIAKYLENHGKIGEAIEYFKKDLARFPANTSSLVELGICYLQLGDYPQAQIWCKKATEARPNDAQAWFNLAMSLRQSNPEEGRAALMKAQSLDPEVILHLSATPDRAQP